MGKSLQVTQKAGELDSKKLAEAVEAFLNDIEVKESTKEGYKRSLRAFTGYLKAEGVARPVRADILAYKAQIRANMSALSVSAYLTSVRRFFAWLESNKVYPNVAKDVKGLKRPKGFLKEALTPTQIRRMLFAIEKETIVDVRDYAMLNLMLRTGLRTIEITRADIGDIGTESGEQVLRVWGKGRDTKDDFVLLVPDAYNPLLDYLKARKTREKSEPLFASHSNNNGGKRMTTRSVRRTILERLEAVGLKTDKITAHSFRHSAGTIALANGADLIAVKEMLRHTDINTTLVYAHNLKRVSGGAERYINFDLRPKVSNVQ